MINLSENKRYYWLRLMSDFFAQPRIKKLRKIAGGDTYTIIYLKMQLLSLRDGGTIFFEGIEDDFAEELALTLNEDAENVKVTLAFLISQGLIVQVSDTEYILPETQHLIGSEGYSAERMRRFRSKKASLCSHNVLACDEEIEKEIDKEKDIELEIENRERVNYQQVADMYNNTCVSFPRLTKLSESRKKAIKARLKNYSISDFQKIFEMAEESDFLKGKNDRNWQANFDWLLKDANMAKVLDGNYQNRGGNSGSRIVDEWQNV